MNLIRAGLYRLLLAMGTFLLISGAGAQTATFPEIEYGFPEMPPRTFTNAKGEPEGTHFRVANLLFAKEGITWHAVSYPPPRLLKNLQTGSTTFSMLVRNQALAECCIYSKDPIDIEEVRVYWTGNKPPIKTRGDLVGKNVIVITGYSYGGLIGYVKDPANKIATEVAVSHQAAFDMLTAGRADYMMDYVGPATDALAERPVIPNLTYEIIDSAALYLVLSKSYPDAEKVMAQLEAIYKSLDKSQQLSNYSKVTKPGKNN